MIPKSMPRRHKQALAIAFAIPVAAIVFAFSLGPAPEKTLHAFYTKDASRAERKHAIQSLVTRHHKDALPALEAILNDESEETAFRADALEAISAIDKTRGRELASLHAARSDHLGTSAKALSN